MLPSKLIGTVVTTGGEAQPFVLETPSGEVRLGRCSLPADPEQGRLGSEVIDGIVRHVSDRAPVKVRQVRLGWYRCPRCEQWFDVVRSPGKWSGDSCRGCR